ncbi:MAG: hypothetical protein ABIR46_03360 [Candidatus Saccharimonadales bacterium]
MAKSVKKTKKSTKKSVVTSEIVPFPGYFEFTKQVYVLLKQSKKHFLRLVGLLAAVVFVLTVSSQQAVYIEQAIGVQSVSSEVAAGLLAKLLETGVLFATLVSGTLTANLSESQQFVLSLVYLLTWLVVVWLVRHILSDKSVSLRDGLYNAGAPIVSTMLIILVAAAQLIPLAILVALVSVIAATGAVNGVLIAVGVALVLAMTVATLYWLVGTLFAAVIVTIPGTYPVAALRSARAVVAGNRAKILRRLLWLALVNVTAYLVVIIPILFVDTLTGYALSWVTVTVSITLGLSLFVYSSTYLYLLYRRIIDEHTD